MEEVDLMAKITIGTIPETDFSQYDNYLAYPHLYKSINDDFTTPGLTLSDCLSGYVTSSYNNYPTLQFTYPRDGIHMNEIQQNRYIMTDSSYKLVHQIFKITHVQQELDQVVVDANHIASVLNDSVVPDAIQFPNASAQDVMNQVLNTMVPQRVFTFESNVQKVAAVNIEKGQQAGSILISPDAEGDNPVNSILGLYGGELDFDNFEIHHADHIGRDTNIIIDYGKNLSQFSHDISNENMWTGAVFTATYNPGQAIAKSDWSGWSNWDSDYSSVGTYTAGGSVELFDSPVEGHHAIGTITNGEQLSLGKVVHDGDMTPDGKYQIQTVNSDDWYPVAGGGWVDARWINFDASGSYITNSISGSVTVQGDNPYEESGAGTRVSMSGYAVVAYKAGGSIRIFGSPEIGPDHKQVSNWTVKNGTVVHYDMVERNQKGDLWYRIGPGQWLFGPHLSLKQDGAYQSYTNSGNGVIKSGQYKYHWDSKHKKMVPTTKTITTGSKSKNHRSASYWKRKKKKVKVPAKKGKVIIDKTLVQGGVTYQHTQYGWVKSSSIEYHTNGSVKPKSSSQIINQQVKDHSKVEIYATPDKNNALNWSIPSGLTSGTDDFQITGHQAKGGDGKTYVEVTYKGKTGWLMEDNINSDLSNINAGGDDLDEDSDLNGASANVDQSQKEVTVTVGPLYADGFGIDPNIDKVNAVDLSSNFIHDDQDLSGQQDDGSFVATQADIDQLTNLGKAYIQEHKYGHLEISDTISYQEMSGIDADWTQLSLYDYVFVRFDKYNLAEKEQVNNTVWDIMAHRYNSISIGKIPETWEHLLLQKANDNANESARGATRAANARSSHLFSKINAALSKEGSDRKAAELGIMKDLGLIKQTTDENGKKITRALVSLSDFDKQIRTINNSVTSISDEILNGGTEELRFLDANGNQNFIHPTQIRATNSDGSYLDFNSQGLGFFNKGNNLIRSAITADGQVAAESITAGTINAVTIKSCLIDSALTIGKENGMNIYVGTRNPGSVLNPLHGGNVIWALSNQYQAMFSSGQIATTGNGGMTRIHPHEITIGDDMNQALTQVNFAHHAYYRIKSWVKDWVADYITINGKKRTIWKGSNKGVNMGKLRNLKDQGKTDYTYVPKSDDYGMDDSTSVDSGDVDLSDMIPSVETVQAIKKHQDEMKQAVDNFNNFIKTGPRAPLHFEDDSGNQTMQNPTRIVAQGSDHSFELNSNGLTYTDSSGQTHAAFGVDSSTGQLKGEFYVDQAYIPKLDASHIETETIHSIGTINGSLAVSDGYSQIQVGMSYGGSEFGIYVGNSTYLTDGNFQVSNGIFDNITVYNSASIGNMSFSGVSIERNDGQHVMWSGSQHSNLGAFINAHIKSSAIIGGRV